MSRVPLLTAALLIGLAPVALAQKTAPATKKLYCWDEGGRRVCGDALPSTAVDRARVEINARSGMRTAELGRAMTSEERTAAEAQARAEAEAAAAAEAEHRRLMAMLESFETEADLRRAFENRIALSQDSIKTARMGIDGLRESLLGLLRRAGEAELAKRPVPAPLAKDIQAQHAQLLRQQSLLVRLEQDAGTIRAQLEDALQRYRELKQPAGAAPAPSPATPATAG